MKDKISISALFAGVLLMATAACAISVPYSDQSDEAALPPMNLWANSGAEPASDAYLAEYGDANRDGSVNIADFVLLKNQFGASTGGPWAGADFDGDGLVKITDFVILKNNFGINPPPLDIRAEPIPEPFTLVTLLAAAGSIGVYVRRRNLA